MQLGHLLVTLGRAKQSQSTRQETKYVADTDIKCSFLWHISVRLPKNLRHTKERVIRQKVDKFLLCNILFEGFQNPNVLSKQGNGL